MKVRVRVRMRALTRAAVRRRLLHHLEVGEGPLVRVDAGDVGALVRHLAHLVRVRGRC